MVFKEKIQRAAWVIVCIFWFFILFGGVEITLLIRRYFFNEEPQGSWFERSLSSWFGFDLSPSWLKLGLCLLIPLLLFIVLRLIRNHMIKPTTEEPQ